MNEKILEYIDIHRSLEHYFDYDDERLFIRISHYSMNDLAFFTKNGYTIIRFDNEDSGIRGVTTPFVVLQKNLATGPVIKKIKILNEEIIDDGPGFVTPLNQNEKIVFTDDSAQKVVQIIDGNSEQPNKITEPVEVFCKECSESWLTIKEELHLEKECPFCSSEEIEY